MPRRPRYSPSIQETGPDGKRKAEFFKKFLSRCKVLFDCRRGKRGQNDVKTGRVLGE
jgi:hypothetical protein